MQELLRQFNGDEQTKNAILSYCVKYFENNIILQAREGKDVKSLAEAINQLEKAFEQLSIDYDVKQRPTEEINQSR